MSDEEKKELEEQVVEPEQEEAKPELEEQPVEEPAEEPAAEPVEEPAENPEEPVEEIAPSEEPAPKQKRVRKKRTKEQRKKSAIKALIIVGSIVLAFAIFISGCAIANATGTKALIAQGSKVEKVEYTQHAQLAPTKDADGYYSFTKPDDRDFKIVQLTDVHIGGGCFSNQKDAWAMNAVATMVRAEQPDLVIVTGDIAYPVPFQAGTFNNLHATQIFANMMEHLGVYWTFTFGNHDTEIYGTHNKQAICDFYENSNFKYCLFNRGSLYDTHTTKEGFDDKGAGNNIIKVKNSAGLITQAIVLLDSHSYFDGDYLGIQWKYDNLHQCQVDWYAQEMDKLVQQNVANGGANEPIKNMAFFHIPLVEYRDAWKQVVEKHGEIRNEVLEEGEVISPEVTYYYGVMGEKYQARHGVTTYGVYCGYQQDEFFETGLTHGLKAIFCGHDHYNNFSISYKGIRLTYGMSIDYLAYSGIFKVHSQRGCTVITLNNAGEFNSVPKNYYRDYNVAAEKGDLEDIEY